MAMVHSQVINCRKDWIEFRFFLIYLRLRTGDLPGTEDTESAILSRTVLYVARILVRYTCDIYSKVLSIIVNIKGVQAGPGECNLTRGVWSISASACSNMTCHWEEQQSLACVTRGISHDSLCLISWWERWNPIHSTHRQTLPSQAHSWD